MTMILGLLIRLGGLFGLKGKVAGIVGGALAALALLLALAGLKSCYDSRVIENHDAHQDAATAKADRRADANAADRRRADDNRLATETTQLKEATDNAPTPLDRRLARARCLRAQQAARASGSVTPACH